MDKIAHDTQSYVDIQSLERLRYVAKNHPNLAYREVAKQFQAYLFQITLKSMNDANKSLSGGLFGSDQMEFYDDLFAQQLSLEMANHDTGFLAQIEANISKNYPGMDLKASNENKDITVKQPMQYSVNIALADKVQPITQPKAQPEVKIEHFASPQEFVKKLWGYATDAAKALNVNPAVLIAQAALETNWGSKIIKGNNDNTSFNLFNIKADKSWPHKTVNASSMEQENGIIKHVNSAFRAYTSFKESFNDYVNLIKNNARYQMALDKATDVHSYIRELQNAGYATDEKYAQKVSNILNSNTFKSMIDKVINQI